MSDAFWMSLFGLVGVVVTQVLLHLRSMRKMKEQETIRAAAREALHKDLVNMGLKVEKVEHNTNGMQMRQVKMAYELGRMDGASGKSTDLGTLE